MQLVVLPSMRPPRPSPRVLRRFERLSRAAHRFHRFAHHPLCGRYAGDVLRIGKRTRVCRGCTLALAGAGAGAVLGVVLPASTSLALGALSVALVVALTSFVRRPTKLLGRFVPSALLAFAAADGLHARSAAGLCAVAAFAALAALYRRRGPDRTPCSTCPERGRPACSGFSPILRREKAVQRLTRRWFEGYSAGESAT